MGIGEIKRRAVFLDRDGVINALAFNAKTGAWESPHAPEDVVVLKGAAEAIRRLSAAGYLVFVVSNQPSYAKGKTSLENIRLVHDKIAGELNSAGAAVQEFFYCYHHPAGIIPGYSGPCECRKPKPHFLNNAIKGYNLDRSASWMVGDRKTDIECGAAAGVRTVLVTGSQDGEKSEGSGADFSAKDLREAAEIIAANTNNAEG